MARRTSGIDEFQFEVLGANHQQGVSNTFTSSLSCLNCIDWRHYMIFSSWNPPQSIHHLSLIFQVFHAKAGMQINSICNFHFLYEKVSPNLEGFLLLIHKFLCSPAASCCGNSGVRDCFSSRWLPDALGSPRWWLGKVLALMISAEHSPHERWLV